jgi:hypothetical protein
MILYVWGPTETFLPIFKVVFRKKIYIFGEIVMLFEGIVGNAVEFMGFSVKNGSRNFSTQIWTFF